MNQILGQLTQFFLRFSVKQRIVMSAVLIAFLSVVLVIFLWANRTEYELLYGHLDPDAAGSIVSDLRSNKIPYRLENGGTTIMAPRDKISELRLRYVQNGYIKDSVTGYELFEKNNLGMTTFMQKLNFKRALEGELMRTINQFPEVRQSRVHLVIPQDRLFEGKKEGSASVVLHLRPGTNMNQNQIKGIAALVANSVDGIEPKDVVVMDDTGTILLDSPGEENPALGEVGSQFELQNKVESQLQKKVKAIVAGIVGNNNTVVRVSAELNFDRLERTKEEVDPENAAIVSQEKYSESSKNNVDTSNYKIQKVTSNYAFSKTHETYVANSGDIKRLTVAVLVNGRFTKKKDKNGKDQFVYQPRNEDELNQIAALVKSAVGYSEERGDVVEVKNMKFADTQITKDQEFFSDTIRFDMWGKLISYGLLAIGLLLAFFLLKGMLKTSVAQLALPGISLAGQENTLLAGGEGAKASLPEAKKQEQEEEIPEDFYMKKLSPEARAKMKAHDRMTSEVIKFAEENPENATKLLRSWITQAGQK